MTDDIFRIEPIDGKVVVDGRKTISPFNSVKHLNRANIPMLCNDCIYRSKDAGGNGLCPEYKLDSTCSIREDIGKFIGELDTRNPEDVKTSLDVIAKLLFENSIMTITESKFNNKTNTRSMNSDLNTLLKVFSLIGEFSSKYTMTEEKTINKAGDIESIFKKIKEKRALD